MGTMLRTRVAARTEFSFGGENYCDRFAQREAAFAQSRRSVLYRSRPAPARYDPQSKHRRSTDLIPTETAEPRATPRWSGTPASHMHGDLPGCSKQAVRQPVWHLPASAWPVRKSAVRVHSRGYLFRESPRWYGAE